MQPESTHTLLRLPGTFSLRFPLATGLPVAALFVSCDQVIQTRVELFVDFHLEARRERHRKGAI